MASSAYLNEMTFQLYDKNITNTYLPPSATKNICISCIDQSFHKQRYHTKQPSKDGCDPYIIVFSYLWLHK